MRQALFSSTTPHRSCQAWRRSRRDNSRSWLWSIFNWGLRSNGWSGSGSSDSTATTGARSSSGLAARSWSGVAALLFSLAALDPRSLAALDPCWLAAATSFRNTTHREHNTKRHRQTKETVHPDLLRYQTRSQTRGDRPSAHPPPAAVLSLDRSARGILLRRLGNLLRVSPREAAEYRQVSACQTTEGIFPENRDCGGSSDQQENRPEYRMFHCSRLG